VQQNLELKRRISPELPNSLEMHRLHKDDCESKQGVSGLSAYEDAEQETTSVS
jgi:hypothetical protein